MAAIAGCSSGTPASFRFFRNVIISPNTPSELAQVALELFATTNDFTALHGVTGIAALQHLRFWCDDPETFDYFCAQALAAAYVSIGAPPLWPAERLESFVGTNDRTIAAIAAVGANSDDEHIAKLIYTSLEAHASLPNPLYVAVAAREANKDAMQRSSAGGVANPSQE